MKAKEKKEKLVKLEKLK